MTQWAIHSLHSPAVQWDGASYTLNGRDRIKAGVPIYTAETREDAEQWRRDQNPRALAPADLGAEA